MKKSVQILIIALIGVVTVSTAKAQTYDPLAVQRINDLIANNGLQATPDAPETWDFAIWNDETPKQIIELDFEYSDYLSGTVSFAGLATLQCLSCIFTNGGIDKLDLTGCTQLQTLFCIENGLRNLDITSCTALKHIECMYNSISKLDVTNCTQLQNLICYKNYLTELDVANCTLLIELDCEWNFLTELDVTNCTQLQRLHCAGNKLIELDLTELVNLKYFRGNDLWPHLTLYKNEAGTYSRLIDLNTPTFGNPAIKYENGILESTNNTVNHTSFIVQTNKPDFELSGLLSFDYSTVGINTPDMEQLKIYPNPTTGVLHITSDRRCRLDPQSPENDEIAVDPETSSGRNDIKNIEIFDVMGKSVYVETHGSASLQQHPTTILDISNLPTGIYFVKITTDTGVVVKKVVKQ